MFANILYPYLDFAFPSVYIGLCFNATYSNQIKYALWLIVFHFGKFYLIYFSAMLN
jgi:hypothetical protein